jgi:signal-transduction protein with cAMP-binding, CBS, and nucleotidyltransferase domain
MSQRGISSLIVVKDGAPIGIITERDFVKKVCAKQLEASAIKIGTLMSRIRTVADPDTPIQVAVQRMANRGIRRLPIIQEGKVVGIVTVTDLARYLRTILLLESALSPSKTRGIWSASSNVDDDDDDDDDHANNNKNNKGGDKEDDKGIYNKNTSAVSTAPASNTNASPNSIS